MSLNANAHAHFDTLRTSGQHHIVIVQGAPSSVGQLFTQMKAVLGSAMAEPKLHGETAKTQLVFGLSAASLCANGEGAQTPQQVIGALLKANGQPDAEVTGGVLHPAQRVAAESLHAVRRNWLIVDLKR